MALLAVEINDWLDESLSIRLAQVFSPVLNRQEGELGEGEGVIQNDISLDMGNKNGKGSTLSLKSGTTSSKVDSQIQDR